MVEHAAHKVQLIITTQGEHLNGVAIRMDVWTIVRSVRAVAQALCPLLEALKPADMQRRELERFHLVG